MKQREMKFRGKRIDNGKWVYGYYFVEAIDDGEGRFDHLSFIKEKYGDHYCDYEVDTKTVGQHTGLKDKKGKEIYEGDIVEHSEYAYSPFENSISVVEWFDENYCYIFKKKHIKTREDDPQVYDTENLSNAGGGAGQKFYPKIIGNIYENKDLLK